MLNFFKKKGQYKQQEQSINPIYNFKWYEIGEGNPFNKRILDIRPYTQQMITTTKDRHLAEFFVTSRAGIGQEYIGFEFKNAISIHAELNFPHSGSKIEGAGYKATQMEDKWDVYAWDNIIYFVRSWTGVVAYKAFFTCDDKSLSVYKITFEGITSSENEKSIALNNIYFLLQTLIFKAIQPHKIPEHLVTNEEIAVYSFGTFGRNCWYATYEDVIGVTITLKQEDK
jgi:hypothetical protein